MIESFIKAWDERKHEIELQFQKNHPEGYEDIVAQVVKILSETDDWKVPDVDRITCIDNGDYQGTLLFIIAASNYQPSDYWFVKVSYGSCSVCDTLYDIKSGHYDEDSPTEDQVKDYMTLALHIVQGLKELGGEDV